MKIVMDCWGHFRGYREISINSKLLDEVNRVLSRYKYLDDPDEEVRIETIEELETIAKKVFDTHFNEFEGRMVCLCDNADCEDTIFSIVKDVLGDCLWDAPMELDDEEIDDEEVTVEE